MIFWRSTMLPTTRLGNVSNFISFRMWKSLGVYPFKNVTFWATICSPMWLLPYLSNFLFVSVPAIFSDSLVSDWLFKSSQHDSAWFSLQVLGCYWLVKKPFILLSTMFVLIWAILTSAGFWPQNLPTYFDCCLSLPASLCLLCTKICLSPICLWFLNCIITVSAILKFVFGK